MTSITGQGALDNLWSCMVLDLKRLPFHQGSKNNLKMETLMLERIKSLAVTKLHAVIHIVNLHDAKQQTDETVRAFTARVCVIAASCILIKAFSGQDCRAIGYTVLSNLSPSTSRDNSIMANHANQGPGSLTHPPPKWGSITPPCTVPLFGFAIDRAPNPEQPTRALQRPAPGPKYNFALP